MNPRWMSGAVGSIPSLTRSGRPSDSLAASAPSGRQSTALRASQAACSRACAVGPSPPAAVTVARGRSWAWSGARGHRSTGWGGVPVQVVPPRARPLRVPAVRAAEFLRRRCGSARCVDRCVNAMTVPHAPDLDRERGGCGMWLACGDDHAPESRRGRARGHGRGPPVAPGAKRPRRMEKCSPKLGVSDAASCTRLTPPPGRLARPLEKHVRQTARRGRRAAVDDLPGGPPQAIA